MSPSLPTHSLTTTPQRQFEMRDRLSELRQENHELEETVRLNEEHNLRIKDESAALVRRH